MKSTVREVGECLGALEAGVTHFACEDFEDLLDTLGRTIVSWPVEDAELSDIVRISQRLYAVLKIEGGNRALLTQCDVISRLCKQVQTKMFSIFVRSNLASGLDTSQQWIVELRLVQRELANLAVALLRQVESMSTLDIPLDIDVFKTVRSTVHQIDMIVGIVDADYHPMRSVDQYFESFIDLPMTRRMSALDEIGLAFQIAGKAIPRKIRQRLSANETADRR